MAFEAATNACELLKKVFPGRVTTQETQEAFQAERDRPWSQTCWIPSAAYVVLNDAHEVATALAIIKKTGCQFSIRTSGHNPNAGFSSVDGSGVVLDLRGLNEKTLGSDGVLHAAGGCIWGDIYPFLEEHGRSPIGGRERQVGLGGFLTGGGYPAFSSLHGIGPDGVKGCEIVLADGSIVEANANTNSDLWRALKGGTSNFGIATRFDINTHPLIKAKFTIKLYDPSDYVNINAATIKIQEAMENNPKLNVFTNFNKQFVAVIMIYADSPPEMPPVFEAFEKLSSHLNTAVPPTDGTVLTLVQTLSEMGHVPQSLSRKIGTVTTKVSADLYDEVNRIWQSSNKKVPEGGMLHYTIQPLSSTSVKAGEEAGGNSMGLEKVPQCWWVFTAEWPQDLPGGSAIEQAHNELLQAVEKLAKDKGVFLDFICPSFAGAEQNVLRGFGEDNVRKLKEVSHKYDPEGVFQKLQNNGFLLRNI
ncbi:hypothetical protein N8I77_012167 [Diaporthe amygdali]|uniref:FAD-binding PCMH-type domain-containing protein n=1 Tax=Phomopsis amygdali TaxID=1214568 RepID=A0AAD9S552_PHOAM|nr:hypothetical protein N8I77_012167 [Diaporthe amygdali]